MKITVGQAVYEGVVTFKELPKEIKDSVCSYKGSTDILSNEEKLNYYNNKYGYNYSMDDLLFISNSPRFLGLALNEDQTITFLAKGIAKPCQVAE